MANLSNINGKFVVEQTTGFVGIGTTDPNFLIEAAGTNAELALNASSIYRIRSTASDEFIITKNGVGDRLIISGGGDATFSGKVGIGGSPTFKLDVLSNGSSLRLNSEDANGAYITWANNGTVKGYMGSSYHLYTSPHNLNTDIAIRAIGGLGLSSNDATSPTLYLNTSGNSTFTGNVGIGISPITGWGASSEVIQLGDGVADYGALAWNTISGADHFDLMYQSYFDGTNYKYGTGSANVTALRQRNGEIFLSRKDGGTANATFTWDDSMVISNSGNVGIATTVPAFELQIGGTDVSGTGSFSAQFAVLSEATTGYPSGFIFKAARVATSSNRVLFNEDFGTYFSTQVYATSTAGAQSDIPIVFAPLGGNVGIGTTAPTAKLEVAGHINVINPNPYIWIGESGSGGGGGFIGWNDAGDYLFLGNSYGSAFNKNIVINSSGNVGIGTTTPDALLSTADTNAYTQEWKYAKGYRHFTTSPTSSSGNYNISTKISVNNLRGLCVDYYESGHLYNNGAAYYFRHTRLYIMMEGSTLRINDAVLIQNTGNRTDAIVNAPAVTTNATLECLITSTIKSGFTHYVSADMVGSGFNKIKSIS